MSDHAAGAVIDPCMNLRVSAATETRSHVTQGSVRRSPSNRVLGERAFRSIWTGQILDKYSAWTISSYSRNSIGIAVYRERM